MRKFVQGVGDDPPTTSWFQDVIGSVAGSVTGSVKGAVANELPSKGQLAAGTMAGIVAFWIVGGITLFAVAKLLKR